MICGIPLTGKLSGSARMFFDSGALTAHSIDAHEGPLNGQQVEQLRDRHELAGFALRAARGLSVDRYAPSGTQASDAA